MPKAFIVSVSVDIPENVEVGVEGGKVIVKGPLGIIERDYTHTRLMLSLEKGKLLVKTTWPDKKTAAMVMTISSHIRNMVKGVTQGFTYKLKIAYAHFPMSAKLRGDQVVIENFGGERSPRIAKIRENVNVKIEDDDIVVKGIDLQDVSQTAANIQQATRIKKRDPRIFLDGIYVSEQTEGM